MFRRNNDQELQDLKDMHRKQTDAMKRLKEQQLTAMGSSKTSSKAVLSLASITDQQSHMISKVQKSNASTSLSSKQLRKSQSGEILSGDKTSKVAPTEDRSVEHQLSNQQTVTNKQIGKSKSTSSVPMPNQKTVNEDKKV